ncbi:helix-turn-helix transcriptional regulator [Bradyrhizobium elkanii]|uniref:helix-turn-helix transcriptional regulator n=1 Tax=Bradyrhizobium elkanii TaxID=29448 RepID=UPI00209E5C47|nr:AraC family transcriptional regulator [Bradyrhizobium elkanii]MCP1968504.1 AraC-like DNA-binding protein [Bradyrhizobium elkanii]MCS4109995.1 AraC-like DNA-binding protein [Bradyrhizobium elkanii]
MAGISRAIRGTCRELSPSWFEPCLHSAYFHISASFISASAATAPLTPRLLPISDFLSMLEECHAAAEPEIGIDMGLAIPAAAHGSMGLSAMSSQTLWDAMVAMVRYAPVRNAMFTHRCLQQGDQAIIEMKPRLQLGEFEQFMGYATVLAVYNVLKAISGNALEDRIRLAFPWGAPNRSPVSQIAAMFDFDSRCLGVRVPLDLAMRPSYSADSDLCDRLKMAGEDELSKHMGSTAAKVRHLLQQKTATWPSLQEVADKLAMSKRSVIRRLESEQLSYQLLLDEVRTDLACWFLRRSDMQLSEIAEQIGFSDQAGFTRSFRRVRGCTPSQYRFDFRHAPDPI